jgi:hypothetical protein
LFGPDSVVVAAPDQRSTNVGAETVITGLRTGNYYILTAVGARVWQLVQTPIAVREVQQTIAGEYDVAFERCARDVLELLESMRREGLLEQP